MESVVEQEKEQGEVQDLSYTELRARLPNEISNEIVMLLANSKQALLDFANIQTTQDIQSFNQQYDVNLTLPQGATHGPFSKKIKIEVRRYSASNKKKTCKTK